MGNEELESGVNPTGPYKPRKLKMDQYHVMLRKAREHKPHNSLKDAQHERTREKWEKRNKQNLERRREFVKEKRKSMGLSSNIMATSTIRNATDIQRALIELETDLNAVQTLLNQHKRFQTSASSVLFSIGTGKPKTRTELPTNSPAAPDAAKQKLDQKSVKHLQEKSEAIQRMHAILDSIDALSAQVQEGFPNGGTQIATHMSHINALRSKTEDALNSEYNLLQELATAQAPKKFTNFCDRLATVVKNAIQYSEVEAYMYAFEVHGHLSIARYLRLETLTMDDGRLVPELYIIASFNGEENKYYLDVTTDWVQPGPDVFVKPVDISDSSKLIRSLSALLSINHFTSSIGDLPVSLLVSPQEMKTKIKATDAVTKVAVDDETGALTFYLRPEIQDEKTVREIAIQLHADVQKNLARRNSGTLRHVIQMDPDPKRSSSRKNYRVTFVMNVGRGELSATPDDLDFLSARYGLTDGQVEQITRIINKARR